MTITRSKSKLLRSWQPHSSGKIKIHKHCSVITFLASDWLTGGNMPGFSSPLPQQKEKSLSLANNAPAGFMNRRSLWASYFPPRGPALPPSPFKSPNRRHAACCWSVHMTNYYWAYYQKSALAGGSGWGSGGEEEGCGRDSNKACWASADKREGQISPAADKQKELISITNGCRSEATKSPTKVTRSQNMCVSVCVYLYSGVQSAYLLGSGSKEGRREGS